MAPSITFSELTNSKRLEIKMINILSFYEGIAIAVALQMKTCHFEIIAIEQETQKWPSKPSSNEAKYGQILNSMNFSELAHRTTDIVDYLIEREQRQSS